METDENPIVQVNEEYLNVLVSMGIPPKAAKIALMYTGNESPDLAATFYYENPDVDYNNINIADAFSGEGNQASSNPLYKMVFVVNSSLEMGVGKIAAQVAHAAVALYEDLIKEEDQMELIRLWNEHGSKKIVLRGNDVKHLESLMEKADSNKVTKFCLVQDAGRTQIPSGSVTVLGLFGEEEKIDSVTGTLPLL